MGYQARMTRPLVIGASGLVGGALFRRLGNAIGTYRTVPKPGLVKLDLADDPTPFLRETEPSAIFLAAALTWVDYCETHEDEAAERNVEQLKPILHHCAEARIPLVFFSTDYIFDGKDGPYAEDARPNPLNVYGMTKLRGEELVRTLPKHAIVRITNVFDMGLDEKNFLYRTVTSLRDGKEIAVPDDQLATPTYATWLADHVVTLMERGVLCSDVHVLNAACDEQLSRCDFAVRVARLLGADTSLVKRKRTSELRQEAVRPLVAGLKNDMLKSLLGIDTLSVDDALADALPRMREIYGKRP